jgi:hypothetical protein
VTKDAEGFAARLSQNGATVASIATLGLREIFLQLVRRVIHLEFASAELPHGLDWHDRVAAEQPDSVPKSDKVVTGESGR